MNKYKYIVVLIVASLSFSCDKDYLDVVPDNVATIDNAFSDRFNAFKYLRTCYSYIPDASSVTNTIGLTSGDEVFLPGTWDTRNGSVVRQGFLTANAPRFDYWNGQGGGSPLYVAIRNCNIFLKNIDNVLDLDAWEKQLWIAEVKFLKAYYHFYLLRMYGPIILNKEMIEVNEDYNNYDAIGRDAVDETFLYIVELLDEAIQDLPSTIENVSGDLGRITKPIAASIKARVLMNYASPLFNGNTVFAELTDDKGAPLFPISYDEGKWELAATACKEAIDICHEAGITLHQKEDYTNSRLGNLSQETILRQALRQRVTENWNNELIWGYTGNSSTTLQRESFPRLEKYLRDLAGMRHAPTLRVAEVYYSKNGVPIDEDVNYDYNNRYKLRTSLEENKYHIKEGEETAALNFDREPRFYADLGFDRGIWFENGKSASDLNAWTIRNRRLEDGAANWARSASLTGYFAKKLIHLKSNIQGRNATSSTIERYAFPIIRLADLYLYYAEALNEVKGSPDGEVYEYIDLVRERAELPGVVDSWNSFASNPGKPLTKDGMREIIQHERLIELSLEGRRYWDLRRWKQLKDKMNTPFKGWNTFQEEAEDYYSLTVLSSPSFSEKDYFWPIRESELVKNPFLDQNVGW